MEQENIKLNYTIYKYSSYTAIYVPENIMVNKPSDQLSRWFTDSFTPSQFILLKLQSPAIVESISFGKYLKAHVSDLRRFQIYGGTDEDNLSLLLTAGLKKDNSFETFRLRHKTNEGFLLPIQYVKIVPLMSWGPAYNYTIWYVELRGKQHDNYVTDALETINLRKEEEAVRILLKHLRRRRYKDAFEALSRETGVQLEGPLQTRLWNALVENADYKLSEQILDEAVREGEFDWYLSSQPYVPKWKQMEPCSFHVEESLSSGDEYAFGVVVPDLTCADREPQVVSANGLDNTEQDLKGVEMKCDICQPGPRGGHQLLVDSNTGTLYLFGGWNGISDLDDLWSYDTCRNRWRLLCHHSGAVGGPSPRSCHKMVLDLVHGRLFLLGRYLESSQRVPQNMNSDLYKYEIESGEWSLICADTAAVGGPRLVFDHQMCIDSDTQTIYVFGGRVLPTNTEEAVTPQYSGLYAYYISSNTWQLLLDDSHDLPAPKPRVSHSMLFHPVQRRLYIFAGQRNKEHLLDLWWWDVNTGQCGALCTGSANCPPPSIGFTQRATLDPNTDEMFVLSGMSKIKDKKVYNTLWVFSLRRLTWTCLYRNDKFTSNEPLPRYAHQLVLDPVRKIHYLFGGNPGKQSSPRLRLDDLWSLKLCRPSVESVFRDARIELRENCYRALAAADDKEAALRYLQHEVADVLDHSDPNQVKHFQKLATVLFMGPPVRSHYSIALNPRRTRTLQRRRARAPHPVPLARALAAVLGADDSVPEPMQPFEEVMSPTPESWDVGEDEDETGGACREWDERTERIQLYETLCRYFRPSVVPPAPRLEELLRL